MSARRSAIDERHPFPQSVLSALQLRRYSAKTAEACVGWVRRFVSFYNLRHPRSMGAAEVSAFLSDLASQGGVSASTQNRALAALLFPMPMSWSNRLVWSGKSRAPSVLCACPW